MLILYFFDVYYIFSANIIINTAANRIDDTHIALIPIYNDKIPPIPAPMAKTRIIP